MYIQGDIIPGVGRVENNHCGLPWVVGMKGEYCGVVQVGQFLYDAVSGEVLSREEIDKRLNNYAFDYEDKSRDCLNWRKRNNKERYLKGKQIDECIRYRISPLRWKIKCFLNRLFNRV